MLLLSGFSGAALEPTLPALYLWFALGGAGVGIVYDIAVNTPSRWFDERRGMATGAVSMAFSGTSFALIPFVRRGVDAAFVPTLSVLAVATGGSSLVAAGILRHPAITEPERARASGGDAATDSAITWRTMVRTRRF